MIDNGKKDSVPAAKWLLSDELGYTHDLMGGEPSLPSKSFRRVNT